MFGDGEDPAEVEGDVREEASRFGEVVHVHADGRSKVRAAAAASARPAAPACLTVSQVSSVPPGSIRCAAHGLVGVRVVRPFAPVRLQLGPGRKRAVPREDRAKRCGPSLPPAAQGFVYLRLGSTQAAEAASRALNGRWYGGRQIIAEYQFLPVRVFRSLARLRDRAMGLCRAQPACRGDWERGYRTRTRLLWCGASTSWASRSSRPHASLPVCVSCAQVYNAHFKLQAK
jgi:hypothetical protein